MKKSRIIIIAFLSVAILALVGCGNKTALTPDQFKSEMTKNQFQVQDATAQFAGQPVKQVYIALNGNWQIEFYQMNSESDAQTAFSVNKRNFEKAKSSVAVTTEENVGNVNRYTQTSNGKYSVISRIGDTFVYLNAEEKYKADAGSILKDLGY